MPVTAGGRGGPKSALAQVCRGQVRLPPAEAQRRAHHWLAHALPVFGGARRAAGLAPVGHVCRSSRLYAVAALRQIPGQVGAAPKRGRSRAAPGSALKAQEFRLPGPAQQGAAKCSTHSRWSSLHLITDPCLTLLQRSQPRPGTMSSAHRPADAPEREKQRFQSQRERSTCWEALWPLLRCFCCRCRRRRRRRCRRRQLPLPPFATTSHPIPHPPRRLPGHAERGGWQGGGLRWLPQPGCLRVGAQGARPRPGGHCRAAGPCEAHRAGAVW